MYCKWSVVRLRLVAQGNKYLYIYRVPSPTYPSDSKMNLFLVSLLTLLEQGEFYQLICIAYIHVLLFTSFSSCFYLSIYLFVFICLPLYL